MTIALKPNADGSAEIQVNGTPRIQISSAGVVTFPGNPNPVRTWQNLTASRAAATPYTNNTGRDIEVSIEVTSAVSQGGFFTITLTGAGSMTMNSTQAYIVNAISQMTFTVPAGATYTMSLNSAILSKWNELR